MITESRFKGEGEDRERSTTIIFQKNAQMFAEAVSKMSEKLGRYSGELGFEVCDNIIAQVYH